MAPRASPASPTVHPADAAAKAPKRARGVPNGVPRSYLSLVRAALPGALVCDPLRETCAEVRPSVVYLQDGSLRTIEGLSECTGPVNAARAAALDAALARYAAEGCPLLTTPCPVGVGPGSCWASDRSSGGSCYGR